MQAAERVQRRFAGLPRWLRAVLGLVAAGLGVVLIFRPTGLLGKPEIEKV